MQKEQLDFFHSSEKEASLQSAPSRSGTAHSDAPLAFRMRPRSLEEVAGQSHLLSEGKLLARAIRTDTLSSAIFYGPPGCGKTTVAEVIAKETDRQFCRLSAVTSRVNDVRDVVSLSRSLQASGAQGAVMFLDEIHRFNKAQQDVLLPHVENGTIVLIGATTENPYFALNTALISRSRIFAFQRLEENDILEILVRALKDAECGLGKYSARVPDDACAYIAAASNGDARVALNALETAVLSAAQKAGEDAKEIIVTKDDVTASLEQTHLVYDRSGDMHYDIISAFIKSMRGSDPDAALYWLAAMLESGEDPRFIARRLVIFASEDIGCADPHALPLAMSGFHAVEKIGLPEAQINLGHVTTYLASAPKSNASYAALNAAQQDVKGTRTFEVPDHLKDSHYSGAKNLGHGDGYKYSHNYEGHFVPQEYMPEPREYYTPSDQGAEKAIGDRIAQWREKRDAARRASNSA